MKRLDKKPSFAIFILYTIEIKFLPFKFRLDRKGAEREVQFNALQSLMTPNTGKVLYFWITNIWHTNHGQDFFPYFSSEQLGLFDSLSFIVKVTEIILFGSSEISPEATQTKALHVLQYCNDNYRNNFLHIVLIKLHTQGYIHFNSCFFFVYLVTVLSQMYILCRQGYEACNRNVIFSEFTLTCSHLFKKIMDSLYWHFAPETYHYLLM